MVRVRWMFFLLLLVSSQALAQDAANNAHASDAAAEHFERGVTLFKEQAYRASIVEFQRAYDLAPDYRLLYNLGRAKHQLQDYLGASENYEAYLVQGGSEIALERRAQVEETLASLSKRVARLNVSVSRPGADVFVDDVKVGVAPLESLVRTNVGSHRVSARTANGATGAQIVDVAGGDLAEVRIVLTEPERLAAAPSRTPEALSNEPWSTSRKLALTGWIAGGVLLAGSVVTGVLSLKDQDHLHSQVGMLGVDQTAVENQRSKVDTTSMTTDVLIGVGAALAVAGTVLWLVSPERAERKSAARPGLQAGLRVRVGVGSLALGSHF